MHQLSIEDTSYLNRPRKTRMQKFLERMDAVLPWKKFVSEIAPYYPKGERGRRPIPLETMLRVYFLQQWYGYSDPCMEDALYDNVALRRFASLEPGRAPNETTICKFRHLLEQHGLTKKLLELSRRHLAARGILVQEGTIVDAAIITAPSSTKNKARERDPEMNSTKKGNTWHFGMKAHIGTDTEGHVHSVEATTANMHGSTMMEQCMHGKQKRIYGDKAYACAVRKKEAEGRGVVWRVSRKATKKRKLNCADRSFNKKSSRTRPRVKHPFGVIKHLWGYRKTQYRGLKKNATQVYTLFTLANFYMACKKWPYRDKYVLGTLPMCLGHG